MLWCFYPDELKTPSKHIRIWLTCMRDRVLQIDVTAVIELKSSANVEVGRNVYDNTVVSTCGKIYVKERQSWF